MAATPGTPRWLVRAPMYVRRNCVPVKLRAVVVDSIMRAAKDRLTNLCHLVSCDWLLGHVGVSAVIVSRKYCGSHITAQATVSTLTIHVEMSAHVLRPAILLMIEWWHDVRTPPNECSSATRPAGKDRNDAHAGLAEVNG